MWKPSLDDKYFYPNFSLPGMVDISYWKYDEIDQRRYALGLIRETEEEALKLARQIIVAVNTDTVIEKQQLEIMRLRQKLSDMGVNE